MALSCKLLFLSSIIIALHIHLVRRFHGTSINASQPNAEVQIPRCIKLADPRNSMAPQFLTIYI